MRIPRVSLRSLIYLVGLIALDCAWAPNIWRMKSIFGFDWHCLDLPALGALNILAIAGYPLLARTRGRPFVVGFVVSGTVIVLAYLALIWLFPTTVARFVNDYLMIFQTRYAQWVSVNDAQLDEPGYVWRYVPLDALLLAAGSIPLLVAAALVGALAKWGSVFRAGRGKGPNPGASPGDSGATIG